MAKAASDDLLAKADPTELIEANRLVAEMVARHKCSARWLAMGEEILAKLAAHAEYKARSSDLDRLERRSDARFAVTAPAPSRMQ